MHTAALWISLQLKLERFLVLLSLITCKPKIHILRAGLKIVSLYQTSSIIIWIFFFVTCSCETQC